jgi:hypothetical protein
VFHLDLVTPAFKKNVFLAVPRETQFEAISRVLTGRSPESVLAEKCADPDFIGYEKLYILFLEHSKKKIAMVFSLLAREETYPVLIHCVHGCASLCPHSLCILFDIASAPVVSSYPCIAAPLYRIVMQCGMRSTFVEAHLLTAFLFDLLKLSLPSDNHAKC